MAGKSALVRHVLGVVRADEDSARSTVLVAQSSAALGGVTLYTAKQWLQRWKGPQLSGAVAMQRLLEAAGIHESEAQEGGKLAGALGVLLGAGPAAPVPVSQQLDALVAVLSGLATQRSLILCVEDAEHLDPSSEVSDTPACGLSGPGGAVQNASRNPGTA